MAVASAQTRQAVASLGGQSVPSANRMFSRDRELAVSSGRQSQMTDRDED
ncbi:stress-induced protein [Salinarimonas soli]|uniref:Stress-induced protein n=1 Tax=Salinarimonas soli TaxID=1638099 RepID=A0A5B2VCT4_9HYPH|nr:stress-induced protein [Salinarimonas soli]